jgi:phage terminase Nu1 subunit (DNA packaging protein)
VALSAFEPVGRQDMAGLLGVSLRGFTELEAKGAVTPIHRGRGGQASVYDVRATLRAYIAHKAKEPARDRWYRLQADKVELENRVKRGEVLEAPAVEREWGRIATTVKRAVLGLPGRLCQLGLIDADQLAPTTACCHDVIRHLGKAGGS